MPVLPGFSGDSGAPAAPPSSATADTDLFPTSKSQQQRPQQPPPSALRRRSLAQAPEQRRRPPSASAAIPTASAPSAGRVSFASDAEVAFFRPGEHQLVDLSERVRERVRSGRRRSASASPPVADGMLGEDDALAGPGPAAAAMRPALARRSKLSRSKACSLPDLSVLVVEDPRRRLRRRSGAADDSAGEQHGRRDQNEEEFNGYHRTRLHRSPPRSAAVDDVSSASTTPRPSSAQGSPERRRQPLADPAAAVLARCRSSEALLAEHDRARWQVHTGFSASRPTSSSGRPASGGGGGLMRSSRRLGASLDAGLDTSLTSPDDASLTLEAGFAW